MVTPPGKFRIAPEDVLDPEQLLLDEELQQVWPTYGKRGKLIDEGRFTWIRTAASTDGHLLGPDGMTAYCGMPLYPVAPFLWDTIRAMVRHTAGPEMADKRDPGEYWIAIDRRKGNKCSACKPAKGEPTLRPDTRWEENELAKSMADAMEERPLAQSLAQMSPTERMARQRLNSMAARLQREFGGTIQ
jgi:hypothetical protein